VDNATQHLLNHGIRPSVQRVAIMEYLMKHHTHPTVDTIYHDLLATMPTLSRTTVYNTLELLQSHNAVQALTIDSRNVHYDGMLNPHAHFMCRCCGRIIDLPMHSDLPTNPLPEHVSRVEQIQLNYSGVCDACSLQHRQENN
jgi:Fe2+ or Zn2+ uptake regulation protein